MILLFIILAVCVVVGIPICYALGISALGYLLTFHPELLTILPQKLFAGFSSESMMALPLFIVMGGLMNESGLTQNLIDFANLLVGKLKGGLACINVVVSMIFGGISGSSTADVASVGAIMIPEMKKRGYTEEFSAGVTVASATMGMVIPPSVPMIMFCVTAEYSIGRAFMSTMFPGLLVGIFQLILCIVISYKKNFPKANFTYSLDFVLHTIRDSLAALVMPLIVLGSVTFGIATSNESAAFAVAYAIIIGRWLYKAIRLRELPKVFTEAMKTCTSVMLIISISQLYVWIFTLEKVPQRLGAWAVSMHFTPVTMMLFLMVIILIAGTFIDCTPAILLITPIFLPVCVEMGIPTEQFAALLVTGLAVGNVTPPVGNCLNVCAKISDLSMMQIFRGALPFICCNVLALIVICLFPQVSTFLPTLLFG